MPTYDYECKTCDEIFEVFQQITAEKLEECPKCGSKIKRLFGAGCGVIFKGSGFYETDFKNKRGKPDAKSKTTDKKNVSTTKSGDSKSESKTTNTKNTTK